MTSKASQNASLSDIAPSLPIDTVWFLAATSNVTSNDVAGQTHEALQNPLEFPSVESAIVPGDRVALAVDPNVPQLDEVITGILKTLALTEAGEVDIVFWDEASESTIQSVREIAGDSMVLEIHQSGNRESLRYLAADHEALPIYLNRLLVDADFVLPVVASRPMDAAGDSTSTNDVTGVFPSLADSSTRQNHRRRMTDATSAHQDDQTSQIPWLLGVHLAVAVDVNANGKVGEVISGTPDAIRRRLSKIASTQVASQQSADLVIASIDGEACQQTWANAARALATASRLVSSGGTIVLWTEIDQAPSGPLARLDDMDDDEMLSVESDQLADEESQDASSQEQDFPRWQSDLSVAVTFARVLAEHRVLLRSSLPLETIEPMGLGAITDLEQLIHLGKSFDSCCIVSAAQFADCAVDSPHRTNTVESD